LIAKVHDISLDYFEGEPALNILMRHPLHMSIDDIRLEMQEMKLPDELARECMLLCVIDPEWCRKGVMFRGLFRDILVTMERIEDDTLV
jgi:hypothetical protein